MREAAIFMLAALLAGCTASPPPALSSGPAPEDQAAPSSKLPYQPVLSGTAYHGVGGKP